MTALWASVADQSGEGSACGAALADAPAPAADPACEAWWTADERYVLRVAAAGGECWYVGELEGGDAGDALAPASPRPPRDAAPPTRTMLVGRQRGRRTAPAPMRLHVRRPPRV